MFITSNSLEYITFVQYCQVLYSKMLKKRWFGISHNEYVSAHSRNFAIGGNFLSRFLLMQ
ncbi:hypothetical protein FACS1894172_00690 [Spirochaetia bacterium]|nr:hypothetical protein FACS1894172_00690 [Spirochaetia bacterium]